MRITETITRRWKGRYVSGIYEVLNNGFIMQRGIFLDFKTERSLTADMAREVAAELIEVAKFLEAEDQ